MKSTVSKTPCEEEIEYPCLMRGEDGLVVFMFKDGIGMVVHANSYHPLGKHSNSWSMHNPFKGSVCLEN